MSGEVFLVGGGPGDPGLITCRGRRLLNQAQTVIYDRLIETALLNHTDEDCELIYAGKKPGDHSLTQAEINELMVEKARKGEKVVRLKGGDPFLFGRGGEEADHLRRHGVPYQVVPGITSALAVPAYAGIPATERNVSSSVTVITGHEDPDKDESSHEWEHLAGGAGTLIFLMGVGNLPRISRKLMDGGMAADTPVALIEMGTCPEQRSFFTTLDEAGMLVRQDCVSPPAVIVVGEVAGRGKAKDWRQRQPLRNLRILNTRPSHQNRGLTEMLEGAGAVVREAPAINITAPESFAKLDRALEDIGSYDWLVLTSQNGVRYFWRRMKELKIDVRNLAGLKLAAIGSRTAGSLEEKGLRVDFVPDEFVAEEVLEGLLARSERGDKILLPRTLSARELLAGGLEKEGREVDEIEAYRTEAAELPPDVSEDLAAGKYDLITFTSSSTASCLKEQLEAEGIEVNSGLRGAAIGPITADTARREGFEIAAVAEEYTAEGLYRAILDQAARTAGAAGEESEHA